MDPSLFLADLEAKPDSLRELAAALDRRSPWSGLTARPNAGRQRVLLFGMGSSRFAAEAAAAWLRRAGVDATAEYATNEWTYPERANPLAIAISASGSSVETLAAATRYRNVVALTNDVTSPLARMSAATVAMLAGAERGGVACRSYTHTLVLLLDLAARLSGRVLDVAALTRRAADACADLLARRGDWLPQTAQVLDGPHGVYVLAPARRLASAYQSALMIREGPRRPADACETGDWSHVDVYLTKTLSYRALLLTGSQQESTALDWMRERGSSYVSVGAPTAGGTPAGAALRIRHRDDDDDLIRLFTETLIAELLSWYWWSRPAPAAVPA